EFWDTFIKNGNQYKRIYKELLDHDFIGKRGDIVAPSYDGEGFALFEIVWVGSKAVRLEFTGTAK
nr:hypothetical protein [Spirochaetia bacterium]